MFTVIAYYTKNSNYEALAQRLAHSCSLYNIPNLIVPVENKGSWKLNTYHKAAFIHETLEKIQAPVLYTDVDSVFNSYPTFIDTIDADIALRYQDFSYRKNECLSGTIYLNYTPITRELLNNWICINQQQFNTEHLEQNNLHKAIQATKGLRFTLLPPEYCFIFDTMRKVYPDAKPVIEHFQQSRKENRWK